MANTFNHNGKVVINDSGQMSVNTTSVPYVDDKLLVSSGHIIIENNWSYLQYSSTGARVSIISLNNSNNISVGQSNVNHGSLNLYGGTGFVTINAGASEVARFTAAGNVGIGTTSPGYSLDVAGTSRSDLHIFRSNQSAPTADAFIFRPADNTVALGTANSERIRVGSSEVWFKIGSSTTGYEAAFANDDNGFNIYASRYGGTGKYLTLNSTGAVENMRLTSNGNVGIGTTSPTEKLHVVGNIKVEQTSNVNAVLTLNPNSGVLGTGYQWNLVGANSAASYAFQIREASSTYLTITNSAGGTGGNVGIGTTAPDAKLVIVTGSADSSGNSFSFTGYGSKEYVSISKLGFIRTRSSDINGANMHFLDNGGTTRMELAVNTTSMTWYSHALGSTFMVFQHTTGNVGIGTTSPGYKLDVSGTGKFSGDINLSNSGEHYLQNDASTTFVGLNFDSPYIRFGVNNTERLRITAAGNVGIGTTSPGAKLHVIGTESRFGGVASGYISVYNANSRSGYLQANEGSDFRIASDTNDMTFYVNGSEKVRFTAGGNVGIGTTSPNEKLHVVGNIRGAALQVYDGLGAGVTGVGAASSGGALRLYSNGAVGLTLNTTGAVQLNDYGTGANTGTVAYNLAVDSSGNIIETAGGVVDGSGTANYVSKWSDANTLTNSVIYENGGNIGIGVTNADYPLTVGSINVGGAGASLGVVINSIISTAIPASSVKAIIGATNSGFGYAAGSLLIQPRTGVNAVFALATEGTEKLRITHDGNVGIGTTAPTAKLDVAGAGLSTDFRVSRSVSPTVYFSINAPGGGPNASTFGVNGVDVMTLRVDGNVGIGTTSPAHLLDVSGTARILNGIYFNNASGSFLWETGANALRFGTNNTERMRIDASGNVGIGTTSPSTKLDVIGVGAFGTMTSSRGTYSNGLSLQNNTGEATSLFLWQSGVASAHIGSPANSTSLHIVNSYNTGLITDPNSIVLTNTGNVGIGTTSPQTKFHVHGYTTIDSVDVVATFSSDNTAKRVNIGYSTSGDYGFINAVHTGVAWKNLIFGVNGGNVGIGTTNPAAKLDVSGSIQAGSGSTFGAGSNGASIYMSSASGLGLSGNLGGYSRNLIKTDGSSVIEIGETGTSIITAINISAGDNTGVIALKTGGNNTRLYVNSSGNVGIGTTSPAFKLDVNAGSNAGIFLQGTSDARYHVFSSSSNDWVGYELRSSNVNAFAGGMFRNNGANNRVSLYNKNSEAISLMDTGNVGIGTTSPTEKLHVDGSVVVTYNNSYQGINSVGNKAILARVSPTTGIINYAEYATAANLNGFVMGSDDARVKGNIATDSLEFITNASERMRITSAGNVGIGTSSPSNILHITNVMRMDNVSASSPNLSSTSAPKYGYGDVSNERYLAEPVIWLKINVGGTEYVIPGYTEVI